MSNSLQPHGLQHSRSLCPSPSPRVYPSSCPLNRWCRPIISSSATPSPFCLQSFPASGSCPMSQLFQWDIRVGPNPAWLVSWWKEKTRTQTHRGMKMVIYTSRREASEGNQLCPHLGLGLPASRLWDNKILLAGPPSPWYFVMLALAKSHEHLHLHMRIWYTQEVAWTSTTNALTSLRPCLPTKRLKSDVSFSEPFRFQNYSWVGAEHCKFIINLE